MFAFPRNGRSRWCGRVVHAPQFVSKRAESAASSFAEGGLECWFSGEDVGFFGWPEVVCFEAGELFWRMLWEWFGGVLV